MPAYARPLERSGQIAARYHIVGAHGGAWVYDVGSNEELERLIALMPIYNFAHYTVYPLAEMPDWDETGAAQARTTPPRPSPGASPVSAKSAHITPRVRSFSPNHGLRESANRLILG